MRVAIVGAGIGGLTTALFLEKQGMSVDLYEQADAIRPVGAGIILAHNAMQAYDQLGLKDTISQLGNPLGSVNIITDDFKAISGIALCQFDQDYAVQSVAIQRSVLQMLLINSLNNTSIQLGKQLVDIVDDGLVRLSFSDGSGADYDAVIAADGIESVVRGKLFAESTLRSCKQVCWRGVADMSLPAKYQSELNEAWGVGHRFGFVSLSPKTVYWYALVNRGLDDEEQGLSVFDDYHPVVSDIIANTPVDRVLESDIKDLKPMASWIKDRVCLLGDAAHATTPNMGQGACQAIEDAYVLSHCMAHSSVPQAFMQYQSLRIKKAQKIVNMSWRLGQVSQWQNPLAAKLRNFVMRSVPPSVNARQMKSIYRLTPVSSREN